MKLGFIGGGNMAHALITGLKAQQFSMSDIVVVEPNADKRQELTQNLGVVSTTVLADIALCDAIVLAVKPQQLFAIAKDLSPFLKSQLVISIAAGVRAKDLSRWLAGYRTIIRTMPNTPAQIQAGITGLYAMENVSDAQIAMADQILAAVGSTLWLSEEEKLDAVTAISGSGPAYVFYLIEALQEAAITLGLNEQEAKQLSVATFNGASLLAASSTLPISTLREQVTSKGGTTEQGLLSLENSKIKQAIVLAASKAFERSKMLGEELGSN